MNIFNYFKKKGIDTVDPSFYRKIAEWISWYEGNVRNFSFYKVYSGRGTYKRCRRKSMGMAKKLSEDIADLLLNERVTITLDDDQTDEYVQQVLDDNRYLSLKCGFGTDQYQFGATGAKTATEIISENSDMYRMIKNR